MTRVMLGRMRRLAVGALVMVLAGCGGSGSTSTTTSAATTSSESSTQQAGSTPEVAVSLPQLSGASPNSQLPTCAAVVSDWNTTRTALQGLAASKTDQNLSAATQALDRLSSDFKSLVQDIAHQNPASSSIPTYDQASSFFFMVGSVFAGIRNHYVPAILVTTASQQEPTVVPSTQAALTSDCLGS